MRTIRLVDLFLNCSAALKKLPLYAKLRNRLCPAAWFQWRGACVFAGALVFLVGMSGARAVTLLGYVTGQQDGGPSTTALTDPNCCGSGFGLHDHVYISPYVPDPERGFVIFTFDQPVVVSSITVVQHANGLTRIEQFVGDDDPNAQLASAGSAWSMLGDITGYAVFAEQSQDTFAYASMLAGTVHKFVIEKTSLVDGYASYRWYLTFATPVTEPSKGLLLLVGLACLSLVNLLRRASI